MGCVSVLNGSENIISQRIQQHNLGSGCDRPWLVLYCLFEARLIAFCAIDFVLDIIVFIIIAGALNKNNKK